MSEIRVSMTDLRKKLGTLVNRAAFGGDRIILVSRGEPRAAIVGVEDLQQLERLSAGLAGERDRFANALAAADLLRERIRHWQEAHGVEPEDAVETLGRLREERADDLAGMR